MRVFIVLRRRIKKGYGCVINLQLQQDVLPLLREREAALDSIGS